MFLCHTLSIGIYSKALTMASHVQRGNAVLMNLLVLARWGDRGVIVKSWVDCWGAVPVVLMRGALRGTIQGRPSHQASQDCIVSKLNPKLVTAALPRTVFSARPPLRAHFSYLYFVLFSSTWNFVCSTGYEKNTTCCIFCWTGLMLWVWVNSSLVTTWVRWWLICGVDFKLPWLYRRLG